MARGELYVPLIVDYADDPKMIEAGEKAEVLFLRALCLMKRLRTDGMLADSQLSRFGLSAVDKRAEALCRVGLWVQVEGGYYCPSFLKHNKSRQEIEELSDRRAAAGRQGGRPPKANGKQPESTLLLQCKPKDKTETETSSLGAQVRARDLIFDALVEVCAIDASQLTSSARGALNRARKELAALGASDEDIRRKAEAYRVQYPGASLTPSALVKHWPALTGVRPKVPERGPSPSEREVDGVVERFFPGTGWVRG